jgi:transposase
VKTGKVTGKCFPRRRAEEFLTFMKDIARQYEGWEIHVMLDNLSTHSTDEIKQWLAKNPNITFHFTPTGSSWINRIETWFGVITKQKIRRRTFGSLKQLI